MHPERSTASRPGRLSGRRAWVTGGVTASLALAVVAGTAGQAGAVAGAVTGAAKTAAAAPAPRECWFDDYEPGFPFAWFWGWDGRHRHCHYWDCDDFWDWDRYDGRFDRFDGFDGNDGFGGNGGFGGGQSANVLVTGSPLPGLRAQPHHCHRHDRFDRAAGTSSQDAERTTPVQVGPVRTGPAQQSGSAQSGSARSGSAQPGPALPAPGPEVSVRSVPAARPAASIRTRQIVGNVVNVPPGGSATSVAVCPRGWTAISGAWTSSRAGLVPGVSTAASARAFNDAWRVVFDNPTATAINAVAIAVCVDDDRDRRRDRGDRDRFDRD